MASSNRETSLRTAVAEQPPSHLREDVLSLPSSAWPEMHFEAEPTTARRGEPVELRWQVGAGAEEVVLWLPSELGASSMPPDWPAIGKLGERVPREGMRAFTPSGPTTIFLVARGPWGIAG